MPDSERHGRVLVIDADQDIADLVYVVLTDVGFTVAVLTHVHADATRVSTLAILRASAGTGGAFLAGGLA